jgi:hypothetical protein
MTASNDWKWNRTGHLQKVRHQRRFSQTVLMGTMINTIVPQDVKAEEASGLCLSAQDLSSFACRRAGPAFNQTT